RALLWSHQIEKAIDLVKQIDQEIFNLLNDDEGNEIINKLIFNELNKFFILLIAKGQFNAANAFFQSKNEYYKQILKPIYFALMHYMDYEYTNEILKSVDELKETIEEIIKEIEKYKQIYK